MTTHFRKNRKKRGHVSAGPDLSASTASTREVSVTPEACTTTGSSSTSTILDAKAKANKDAAPMIDVTQYGYFKVLGKGVLPENQTIVVKAKFVSKTAEKKIKEAGGAVLLTA
ncbi:hypothetical protein like AT1G70600 [Hibiscus trionum]|uniref:Large ribosomal subunit protein uL15/eL18 domain-containing protein n=1 Tax=Hibiscus trionum TaxID=183268 RepID=A0A9W7JCB6_HIBTR|nr:hypothetical protein like AT1G70600 [Hibiscus trionum]